MITNLNQLYKNISMQLPGVSPAILDLEFRKAERLVCRETGVWKSELTFDGVDGTYSYDITLPNNSDLVTTIGLWDWNDHPVDVNDYELAFDETGVVDGFNLFGASEDSEADLEGDYTDSGSTFNGETVYTNGTFMAFLAVPGVTSLSNFYLVCLEADYDAFVADPQAFPTDYYAIQPPASGYTGTLSGYGAYEGTVKGELLGDQGKITVTVQPSVVDDRADLGTFTLTVSLMPRSGVSAAPASVLTQFSEAIQTAALKSLVSYPTSFPWSDRARYDIVDRDLKRLLSLAKFETYRPLKRTAIIMRAQSFL